MAPTGEQFIMLFNCKYESEECCHHSSLLYSIQTFQPIPSDATIDQTVQSDCLRYSLSGSSSEAFK